LIKIFLSDYTSEFYVASQLLSLHINIADRYLQRVYMYLCFHELLHVQ